MIVEDQSEVIAFLSRGETFGAAEQAVERYETHASVVFLVGARAYKLKRAVKYPYLDYSTCERRRHFCEAEVRVNQAMAPALYLGVVPVCRGTDGALRLGAGGTAVDWLVEMTRFEQGWLLDRLATEGRLDRFVMESVADEIAAFHRRAAVKAGSGAAASFAALIEGNAGSFAEVPAGVLDVAQTERLSKLSRQALAACAPVIDRRSGAGFVRRCHGDLHLRNIVVHDGRPVLFDAIEFSDALAEIDVLYDIAFLIMDLQFRGLDLLASILFNRYLDNTGDRGGLQPLPLFMSLRAAIRAHVDAAAVATQSRPEAASGQAATAARYLDLALDYLVPRAPRLIAVGGLSGSGKSRLARHLAPLIGPPPGARVVRTDSTRKRLAGVPLGSRLGASFYSEAAGQRTYEAVTTEAADALAGGRAVIADAVFARPEERAAIARVAADQGVPFHAIWLEASPHTLQERVVRRRHNVSDATPAVVRMQLDYDLGPLDWPRLDSSADGDATVAAAVRLLGLPAPGLAA